MATTPGNTPPAPQPQPFIPVVPQQPEPEPRSDEPIRPRY